MPNNQNQQAVFLQSGDPLTENRPADSYSGGQLGMRFTVIDNTANPPQAKRFQLVQMDSVVDVAASQGAVAWWRNATGYVVTTDVSVAGRGNVAGVFGGLIDAGVATGSGTLGNIGCIQIGGPAPVQFSSGTPLNTGLFVQPTATDAKAEAVAAGTEADYPPMGVTVSASSGGLATVQLDLPGRQ